MSNKILIFVKEILSHMAKRKFDTCFFERYAKLSLATLVNDKFNELVNEDRPDLQMPDRSMGIEVTRAMEESKTVAQNMLKEMAGLEVDDQEDMKHIKESGYGYGIQDGNYVGHLEYEYWSLALPLKRILASKISKVASGFYDNFDSYGLYVFSKDDMSRDDVEAAMAFTIELQTNLDIRYSTLYLSQIDRLYVCDLSTPEISTIQISKQQCRQFFFNAIV